MRTKIIKFLLFCVYCAPLFVIAQTADNKVLTGISVTFMDYKGIVNKQFFNPANFNPGVRLNANMYLNPWLNYTLGASFVPRATYPQTDGTFNPQLLIDANTGLQLKANNGKILNEDAIVAPYIYTGLGYSTSEGKSGMYLPAAVGVRFRLGKNVSLNMESLFRVKFNDIIQPRSHTIGFNFILPTAKEKPIEENVSRGKTKNPKPVITTPKEEPIDTATEEVATTNPTQTEPQEEANTTEPTVKNLYDRDGDGVEDKYDPCPDEAGPIAEGGCPSRHKIAASELPVETLADADNDGVEDSYDHCPNIPGSKDLRGCPAGYEDGKTSEEYSASQNNPTATETPSQVSSDPTEPPTIGEIPVVQTLAREDDEPLETLSADDLARLKIIAMNIAYQPGTDALMPASEGYIQELKDMLVKYPRHKLVIRGHYSAGREEDDNKVMSVKRAFQIKRQLILTKGMTPAKMMPDGFGSKETTKKNESRIELSLVPMH